MRASQQISAEWHGCYDASWKGLITPESFAHPAKFSRALIERIFDHCLERGYLKRGDVVGDPFGGIGTGGIVAAYRGFAWVGCELEARFVGFAEANFRLHRSKWERLGVPLPRIVQGDSRRFAENVSGVVTSPPFVDSMSDKPSEQVLSGSGGRMGASCKGDNYGETPGQIGRLKAGAVDSVIASPPFSGPNMQPRIGQGHRDDLPNGESRSGHSGDRAPGNIETLREGDVAAVISSPPYSDISAGAGGLNTKPAKKPGQQSGRSAKAASQDTDQKYGHTKGQISHLKGGGLAGALDRMHADKNFGGVHPVDGVVSSPPFEDSLMTTDKKFMAKVEKDKRNGSRMQPGLGIYGTTEGRIGQEKGETYWAAVDAVYRSCFKAIKPGGFIVLVVKDYIKGGKRVPLCDDTVRLLEHIGFTLVERVHAMLVKETKHDDLFAGETVSTKSRKSFFRRLAEKKGSPAIDFEEVIFAQKPI